MKQLILVGLCAAGFLAGQAQEADSSRLAGAVEKLGLNYKLPRRFIALRDQGPAVTEKKEVTCYPSTGEYRVWDKKDDVVIRLNFLAITKELGDKVRQVTPDFDENANYLGNEECRRQRESGWLPWIKLKNIRKMKVDSAFCFSVPSADFEPYDGKYECRAVLVLHKRDRGDITVEYFYHRTRERRVRRQVGRIGEMLSFR